jgi:tRNA(Ile)-lysidine synthase
MQDAGPGSRVLVAASGGADSTALAAATVFEGDKAGWLLSAIVVDHQLQQNSFEVAQSAASLLKAIGIDDVEISTVDVGREGGPEAAAREARYAAIDARAQEIGADVVLLGHTRNDQAESVLLGLARGSGARSLRGMSVVRGRFRRPLLEVERQVTEAACRAEGHSYWEDPHNADPAFLRVRVRTEVMPLLDDVLGPGVVAALGRTAASLAADDDALEQWAVAARAVATRPVDGVHALDADELAKTPAAVLRRVLRAVAHDAGVPAGDLLASHVLDMEALVTCWKGQGPVHLPGGVRAARDCGTLLLTPLDQAAADLERGR